MRIACITTPRGDGSRARAWLERIEPHLLEHTEFVRFVPGGCEQDGSRSLVDLQAKEFDQVLYVLANEAEAAYTLRWLRRLGGSVCLLDAKLPALAFGASARLARGGWRGTLAAVRHGGLAQARAYRRLGRGPDGRVAVPSELALERGVTRFGDAFVVGSEELGGALCTDRNEPTPVAVVPGMETRAPEEVAGELLTALRRFPHARGARRPLILAALRAAEEARARARKAAEEGSSGR